MSTGTTVQVIGAVVDVEFPAGQIPNIYDALIIDDAETSALHIGSPVTCLP